MHAAILTTRRAFLCLSFLFVPRHSRLQSQKSKSEMKTRRGPVREKVRRTREEKPSTQSLLALFAFSVRQDEGSPSLKIKINCS